MNKLDALAILFGEDVRDHVTEDDLESHCRLRTEAWDSTEESDVTVLLPFSNGPENEKLVQQLTNFVSKHCHRITGLETSDKCVSLFYFKDPKYATLFRLKFA